MFAHQWLPHRGCPNQGYGRFGSGGRTVQLSGGSLQLVALQTVEGTVAMTKHGQKRWPVSSRRLHFLVALPKGGKRRAV